MAARTLTPARALSKPRSIDVRVWVGLLVALVAALGVLTLLSAARKTRPVLVAARDLPAGAVLSAADLSTSHALLDDQVYAVAVPAAQSATLVGRQLADPLYRGQVVARPQVSGKPLLGPGQLAMTVRIDPNKTAVGDLSPGDPVQVLLTTRPGEQGSTTSVALPRVTVYEVRREKPLAIGLNDEDGSARADEPVVALSFVVSPQQAVALANARHNGELDVALLPPEVR